MNVMNDNGAEEFVHQEMIATMVSKLINDATVESLCLPDQRLRHIHVHPGSFHMRCADFVTYPSLIAMGVRLWFARGNALHYDGGRNDKNHHGNEGMDKRDGEKRETGQTGGNDF